MGASQAMRKLVIVSLFAVAMAFLETAIIVYLRKLFYPDGFSFPLNPALDLIVLGIEWPREFCTIVMLVCLAILAGRTFPERFAYFLYSFAVWDIFYYIWLKVVLDWPASLLTWDVLFLIPVVWAGPVLAPVLCSLTMILFALAIFRIQAKGGPIRIILREWALLFIGSALILYAFLYDYTRLLIEGGFLSDLSGLSDNLEFLEAIGRYVPRLFNWPVFSLGLAVLWAAISLFFFRSKNMMPSGKDASPTTAVS